MDDMTTDTEAGQCRKTPGRPRDARADDAILEAVIALLSSGQSAAAMSMEAVAAKAGVGKATLYRRWPNKETLLVDAMLRMKGPPPVPRGTSLREDLILLATRPIGKDNEKHTRATACLLPEIAKNPELYDVWQRVTEPRRNVTREVLRRGIETGELRADLDVELTTLMLSAPSMAQNLFHFNPAVPAEGLAEKLVDAILRGAAA
ncbi:TetR family transcriptional regulator [Winogradskya humida]|uniref:TetR family transcriptional regulator n=2 Tax=Winogradskya humida TaxID=113566 RepID=A0ABQ3ZIS5_9ACTN|nr:TetR family transcriptional regulator [Actinoplanes humidus]